MSGVSSKDRRAVLAHFCEAGSKICRPEQATALLEAILRPGDRVTFRVDVNRLHFFDPAAGA